MNGHVINVGNIQINTYIKYSRIAGKVVGLADWRIGMPTKLYIFGKMRASRISLAEYYCKIW